MSSSTLAPHTGSALQNPGGKNHGANAFTSRRRSTTPTPSRTSGTSTRRSPPTRSPATTACAGDDTYFLTGTDEHGIKMVKTAAEQGIEPEALADRVVGVFQRALERTGHHPRRFHPHHRRRATSTAVQKIVEQLVGQRRHLSRQLRRVVRRRAGGIRHRDRGQGARVQIRHQRPAAGAILRSRAISSASTKYVPRVLEHIEAHPGFHPAGVAAQ